MRQFPRALRRTLITLGVAEEDASELTSMSRGLTSVGRGRAKDSGQDHRKHLTKCSTAHVETERELVPHFVPCTYSIQYACVWLPPPWGVQILSRNSRSPASIQTYFVIDVEKQDGQRQGSERERSVPLEAWVVEECVKTIGLKSCRASKHRMDLTPRAICC